MQLPEILAIIAITLSTMSIAFVKLYCYFKRNKSIEESGSYWLASTLFMASVSLALIFIILKITWIWLFFMFLINFLSAIKIGRVSLKNVDTTWAEMRNSDEVAASQQTACRDMADYIKMAQQELPGQDFSADLHRKINEYLRKRAANHE